MNRALLVVIGILLPAVVTIAQDGAVRVPENELRKSIATRVDPEYPPMARQLRVTGRVQVEVCVDAEGAVEKVQPLNGNMLLSSAAVNAVKRWKFTPLTENGKTTKAVSTLTFDFKL